MAGNSHGAAGKVLLGSPASLAGYRNSRPYQPTQQRTKTEKRTRRPRHAKPVSFREPSSFLDDLITRKDDKEPVAEDVMYLDT